MDTVLDTGPSKPDTTSTIEAGQHLFASLRPGWLLLTDCRLGDAVARPLRFALLHPEIGVALLDLAPTLTPDAAARLRQRLGAARFGSIFPGHLPLIHRALAARQLSQTAALIDYAFALEAPLSLPGGGAWTGAVQRALDPAPTGTTPTGTAPTLTPPPRMVPGPERRGATLTRRRHRSRGLVAFWALVVGAMGGGGLFLAALGPPAPLATASPGEAAPLQPTAESRVALTIPLPQPAAEPPAATGPFPMPRLATGPETGEATVQQDGREMGAPAAATRAGSAPEAGLVVEPEATIRPAPPAIEPPQAVAIAKADPASGDPVPMLDPIAALAPPVETPAAPTPALPPQVLFDTPAGMPMPPAVETPRTTTPAPASPNRPALPEATIPRLPTAPRPTAATGPALADSGRAARLPDPPAPVAARASPRCHAIIMRIQLGEEPTDADRSFLRSGCGTR